MQLTSKKSSLFIAAFAALAASVSAADEFSWRDIVSDIHGVSHHFDAHSVNPWGVVPGPEGQTIWVVNNGTGTATVYGNAGAGLPLADPLVVTIPRAGVSVSVASLPSAPTGIRLNYASLLPSGANDFVITKGNVHAAARYLFCSEDGAISGYNHAVDPTNAIIAVDHSSLNAVYKGLALAFDGTGVHRLYAADFHNNKIEVFDTTFAADATVTTKINSSDPHPVAGFAPFNIKHFTLIDPFTNKRVRYLAVAYAKQDAQAADEVDGAGLGYINIFDPLGNFIKRLVDYNAATPNQLNAPWGMAVAHAKFGSYGHSLIVGNFGDGKIHRFSLNSLSGAPLGALKDAAGNELEFDGLWGLHFGTRAVTGGGAAASDELDETPNMLIFTAGIVDEAHGLVGEIVVE